MVLFVLKTQVATDTYENHVGRPIFRFYDLKHIFAIQISTGPRLPYT